MAVVTIPKWFDWNAYLNNKLAQVGSGTMDSLVSDMDKAGYKGPEGYYKHFLQWGHREDVSPSAGFDANQYYAFKAAKTYGKDISKVDSADISTIKQAIQDAGMDAWTHYQKFGTSELINASNSFDTAAYLEAKSVAMGGTMSAAQVAKAIQDAGMNAYEHYMQYKGGSGEVPAEATFVVPASSQVDTPGQIFTLTTGVDRASSNVFDAPSLVSVTGNQIDTLQSADALTGIGTNPTLNATLASGTGIISTPTLTGIETLNLEAQAFAQTLNLSKATGLKTVNLDISQQNLTVQAIQSKAAVGVSNSLTTTNALVTFADSVVSGTADVAKVTLTNNGVASVAGTQEINLRGATTGGFETIEVTVNGTNRIAEILSDSAVGINTAATATNSVRTITVAGDGTFRVDTALNSTTTFDASANKGGVNVQLNNAGNITVTGGEGNDTFNLAANLTNSDKVDGGAGRDTLRTTSAITDGHHISNIEVLQNDGALAGTVFDNDTLTSVNTIVHNSANAATYQDMVGANAADSTMGLTLQGIGVATFNIKGATGLGGNTDALYVNVGSATGTTGVNAAGGGVASVTTVGTEKVTANIVANDTAANTASSLTITGDAATAAVVIKGGATGVAFTQTILGSGAALTSIDGSAFVGNLTVAGNTNSQVIKGGLGNDVIGTGGRAVYAAGTAADVLTGNAGADQFGFSAVTGATTDAALSSANLTQIDANAATNGRVEIASITDLNLGGGTAGTRVDTINLSANGAKGAALLAGDIAAGGFTIVNGGAATALTGVDLGAALNTAIANTGILGSSTATTSSVAGNAANFSHAGLFTWGGDTYLVATSNATIGDTFGAVAGEDIVIKVTGVVGTLDASDFV